MAEKLSALFSPDLPAFGKHLFLLVSDCPASLELGRHRRVGLLSDRSGRRRQALIAAQPDRASGDRKHADAGRHAERQSFDRMGEAH